MRTPGREDETSASDWAVGEAGGVVEVGGFGLGELRYSITDLHSWASLECLRQEPFLLIFSRAGIRTWFSRESASVEAIPRE